MINNVLKVFVIDDQTWMRTIVRAQLKGLGISQFFQAKSGNEALELLLRGAVNPDFILCDLHMENGNGIAFINSLREYEALQQKKTIPVIIITGENDELLLHTALQVGAMGILQKPFSPNALTKAMSPILALLPSPTP